MKALVEDLRRMTGVGKAQYEIDGRAFWVDADLERALEKRISANLYQAEVREIPTLADGGGFQVLNGHLDFPGRLDVDTVQVVTIAGKPVEDATVLDDGRVTFTENMISVPTLASGTAYDLNGAAADVLTDWASAVKLGYDIEADGQKLTRSQRHAQLLEQAKAFRARAVPSTISLSTGSSRRRPASKIALETFRRWPR